MIWILAALAVYLGTGLWIYSSRAADNIEDLKREIQQLGCTLRDVWMSLVLMAICMVAWAPVMLWLCAERIWRDSMRVP